MTSLSDLARRTAIVVPTYFHPDVSADLIQSILEQTFQDQGIFCPKEQVLIVVDRDTTAHNVIQNVYPESPLYGIPCHVLPRNHAKAGAVEVGLKHLLDKTDAGFLVTRDCDGDHRLEDLLRMFEMALFLKGQVEDDLICVLGSRPSLEKPMGWLREEWEQLTNHVLLAMLDFKQARSGRVVDRRFWTGLPDIQSGYRLYSRAAAEVVVDSLSTLPDDADVLTLACEFIPFADLVLQGCGIAQCQRSTLIEQPVSSYADLDFPKVYGALLRFTGIRLGLEPDLVLRVFDNQLLNTSLLFTDFKKDLQRCREYLCESPDPVVLPPFL